MAILVAMAIYIRAGREIYKKRRKMLNFSGSGTGNGTVNNHEPFSPTTDVFAPAFKTTEVVQTTEFVGTAGSKTAGLPSEQGQGKDTNVSYSVTISAEVPPNDNDSVDALDLEADTPPASIQGKPHHNRTTSTVQVPATTVANVQARRNFQRKMEAHRATWSYTKCAILFFAALLITWIPSSGNRVYSLINNGDVSKPLFYASALVLPLQGFWNAVIYTVTSWAACKAFFGNIFAVLTSRRRRPIVEITAPRHHNARPTWRKAEETTSMEDLTGSSRTLRSDRVSPV